MQRITRATRTACVVHFALVGGLWFHALVIGLAYSKNLHPSESLLGFLVCSSLSLDFSIPAFFICRREPTKRRATACGLLLLIATTLFVISIVWSVTG